MNEDLQYPVTTSITKRGRFVFKIHIGSSEDDKEQIVIRQYHNWITVNILHPTEEHFGSSQGLLGRFPDGALLGRDGHTIHSNCLDFGGDWVIDSDADRSLLSELNPFPDKCRVDSLKKVSLRRRQLSESSITEEQAQEACVDWGEPNYWGLGFGRRRAALVRELEAARWRDCKLPLGRNQGWMLLNHIFMFINF